MRTRRSSPLPTGLAPLAAPAAGALPLARRRRRHVPWIWRRIGIALLTLVFVSIALFLATQTLPGNAAKQILGPRQTPATVQALEHQLGLDRPVVTQYLDWAGGMVTGDLGRSLVNQESVASFLGPRAEYTFVLGGVSIVLSIILAVIVGVAAAARRDRAFDHSFGIFSLLFTAVPEFVVGIGLVIAFATTLLHVLPAVSLVPLGASPFSQLDVFVLPVATLVLANVPYLGRLVRGSMIEALSSEYVRVARFKGLSERRILYRHALPNALVPLIQGIATSIAYLAGGIVVVEFVFGFPGLGTALVQAVGNRDLPVIQAVGLLLAVVCVTANLLADIAVVYVTPRLRTNRRRA